MATILNFRQRQSTASRPREGSGPAQVVFFTGVRYERSAAGDLRRAEAKGDDRKPSQQQATLPL